ncbi:MAG TPA: hypothetical protein VLG49_08505 [Rhabdochlamydiaceae bacterium]|nr:hypothetical protein [Rhabdochlamydiaceae bacterium]
MSSFLINTVSEFGLSNLIPLFSKKTLNKVLTDDDVGDMTPLQTALVFNNFKTAAKLLECGADPLQATSFSSPIEWIFLSKDNALIKQLTHILNPDVIAIGLSALCQRGCDREVDLNFLGENEQKVRELASLHCQRKVACNVSGIKDEAGEETRFKGHKIKKEGAYSWITQRQQYSAYKTYLRETKSDVLTEHEKEALDFLADHVHFYDKMSSEDRSKVAANIKNGCLEGILTGYKGHCSQFVFYKGYLALCNSSYTLINTAKDKNVKPMLDVYKIDPKKMTSDVLMDIIELKELFKSECNYKTEEILKAVDARKDPLCEIIFNHPSVQNKRQKSGNCTVKSGNVALRFVQMMQFLSEKNLSNIGKINQFFMSSMSDLKNKCIEENKRISTFRKLDALHEISRTGQIEEEDLAWFFEALIKCLRRWAKMCEEKRLPHPAENERILDLLDFFDKKFGLILDLDKLSEFPAAKQTLQTLIEQRHQTRTIL